MSHPLTQISTTLEGMNKHLNDIQYSLLQSDDFLLQANKNLFKVVSGNEHLKAQQTLSLQLKKLTDMHQSLQQKLYSQTLENKQLKQDLKSFQDSKHDQQYM